MVLFEKPSCYHDGLSHMGSGLSLNTVTCVTWNGTWNCILQRGRHLLISHRNGTEFSGPEVIRDGPKDSGNVFSGQTSPHFSLFLGKKRMSDFAFQRFKRPSRLLPTKSAKTSLRDGMGVHQCPRHGWSAYTVCEGPIDAEAYVGILERRILPSRWRLFPGTPATTAWLHRHRVCVLDWPTCSPDLPPIENVWCIMKRRVRQCRPRTVEELKSCILQEWATISLAKLQQLIASVPKRLQSVIKRKVDFTQS